MSDKEIISLFNVPAKTHYIAICIFVLLFGLFYVFSYTNYFKSTKDLMEKWKTNILGSKLTDIVDVSDNDIIDDEPDEEKVEVTDDHNNTLELLSPF